MSNIKVELDVQEARARADALGVPYHHRAGADKINALVNAFLVQERATAPKPMPRDLTPEVDATMDEILATLPEPKPMTQVEYMKYKRKEDVKLVGRLRRIRLQCMNPMKREWNGEIISTGSAKLGTFKKFIPFNGEPYHVPQIIYDMLKERQCSIFHTVKDERGTDIRRSKLINEFAIEDLPPLTAKELEELKDQQALAASGL